MKASVCALALIFLSTASHAADFQVGSIIVETPWTRATPRGATVGGGYLIVRNLGTAGDRLLGGTTSAAARIEIHSMTMESGVARMREMPKGISVGPGETFRLQPAGSHLMFVGLQRALVVGEKIQGTLIFEQAGKLEIEFEVLGMGAKSPSVHH